MLLHLFIPVSLELSYHNLRSQYTQAPHRESSNIPGQGIATNLDSASSQKAPHQPTSSILSPPLLRHHSTIFICRDLVAPEKNVNVIYEAIGDYRTVVDAIGDV